MDAEQLVYYAVRMGLARAHARTGTPLDQRLPGLDESFDDAIAEFALTL
jgi:hypothetical protein